MNSDSPIGVFDSGVGGLSVLRAIRQSLPEEPVVYFGDQAHIPYGTRLGRVADRQPQREQWIQCMHYLPCAPAVSSARYSMFQKVRGLSTETAECRTAGETADKAFL